MSAASRIEATEVGSVAVITVFGEHDLSTQPNLAEQVARLARPGAVIVIDLSPATFIDSSVLHTLTRAANNADTLAVVAPPGEACRRVIDMLGLAAAFTVCDSTDQGLRHVLRSTDPHDTDQAVGLLRLADHLLDLRWQDGQDMEEPLALARRLCELVGREPRIENAKLWIADAQQCTPSEAFRRLVDLSQRRNEKLADLARRLADGHLSRDPRTPLHNTKNPSTP